MGPNLLSRGTDTNHYKAIAQGTDRFSPMTRPPAGIGGAQSTNEVTRVGNKDDRVRFYIRFI